MASSYWECSGLSPNLLGSPASAGGVSQTASVKPPGLRRFHGSATLNATRISRDVDAIATSVVQHLAGLLDAKVNITLEIELSFLLALLRMWFARLPRTVGR